MEGGREGGTGMEGGREGQVWAREGQHGLISDVCFVVCLL